jgi:hypothetical protein
VAAKVAHFLAATNNHGQFLIPVLLQVACNQAVLWLDGHKASPRQVGLRNGEHDHCSAVLFRMHADYDFTS